MNDLANAIVSWVNTFQTETQCCKNITELSDGILFYEIACAIDPHWFKQSRTTQTNDNWVLKHNNLKKLTSFIYSYLDSLGLASSLYPVALTAIARDNDVGELTRLASLVIVLGVQSDVREDIVARIQGLDDVCQVAIMKCIEETISVLSGKQKNSQDNTDMNEDHDGEMIQRIHLLESEIQQLKIQPSKIEDTYEGGIKDEKMPDLLLRTEIQTLKKVLSDNELTIQEYQVQQETHLRQIKDHQKKAGEYVKRSDEVITLRDKVEEYRLIGERLQKTEVVLEKYKKKVEDMSTLRKQVNNLQDENKEIMKENDQLSGELGRITASITTHQQANDTHKQKISDLEKENNAFRVDKLKYENDIGELKRQTDRLLQEKQFDENTIKNLEDKLNDGDQVLNTTLAGELDSRGEDVRILKRKCEALEGNVKSYEEMKKSMDEKFMEMYQKNLKLENEMKQMVESMKNKPVPSPTSRSQEDIRKYEDVVTKSRIDEARYHRLQIEKEGLMQTVFDLKQRIKEFERESRHEKANSETPVHDNNNDIYKEFVKTRDINEALKAALVQAKERILKQEIALKEKPKSTETSYPEAIVSMQQTIIDKDLQLADIKHQMVEMKRFSKKEQMLVLSAWHQLNLSYAKKGINVASVKTKGKEQASWMNEQRRFYDEQVKGRV